MKFTPGCIAPGQRFGRLTTVHELPHVRKSGRIKWLCRCDCGNERPVVRQALLVGRIGSCGCLPAHPLHSLWRGMIDRCYRAKHPAFQHYGGRGIIVCERWRGDFAAFVEDMEPRPTLSHSLDRIENNGPYSCGQYDLCADCAATGRPANVRWATPKEQRRNSRANHLLTYQGRTQTLVEWAEETGMLLNTLQCRINAGWTLGRALTEPVARRKDNARGGPYSRHR